MKVDVAARITEETSGRRHPWPSADSAVRWIAVRLFFTCWLIYAMHLATNTVREIYLGLAIADDVSFRVDEYAGLHPDLFDKPGYGWHINSNPGASMLGAIPYAALKPLVDRIVATVNRSRAAGNAQPPEYNSPWPMAREFFQNSWRRGLDIKFGLAAVIMQTLLMAPFSAAAAVVMFFLLRRLFASDQQALWLTLLYAFGTPVLFRTAHLNQNMLVANLGLCGLAALWLLPPRSIHRAFLAGLAGGACVLMDYSGVVLLAGLFAFLIWKTPAVRPLAIFAAGAALPLVLLGFYQWHSFGHFLYPAQHWMAPVQWIEQGYKGVGMPQAGMLIAGALDYRYGLFTSCPLLLLALPAVLWRGPLRPYWIFLVLLSLALLTFSASVHYSKLQFNTGIRYMVPAVPLLFIPLAWMLLRIPRRMAYFLGAAAVTQAWCMAMYRDVERGAGILEPILHVMLGGFQLPALTVISRLGGTDGGEYFSRGPSPLPMFCLAGFVLYGIWSSRFSNR